MRDPRLLKEQKKSSRPVLTKHIGVEQKKKKKKVLVVRDEAPHSLRGRRLQPA